LIKLTKSIFSSSAPLPQNEELTLTITTELEDLSGNTLRNEFSQTFSCTETDIIIYDRVPPEIQSVRLISNSFFIEFSEEIDSASITDSIELKTSSGTIPGQITSENPKTAKLTPSISLSRNSQYTITVKATVKDLSGKTLSESLPKEFTYQGSDLLIFQKPDPNQRKESSIGNTTLFQGREYDPETGLYYFRARYYHPELGRFLSEDPLGYKDSFNLSQAFLLNPLNFSDPYGKKNDWDIGPFAKRKEPLKRRPTGLPEPETTKSFYWKKADFWWNQIPSWDIGYFLLPESLNRLKFSSEKERSTAGLMLSPLASVFILSGGGGLATGMGIPLEIVNVMEIGGIVSGTTGTMSSLIKKEDPLAGAVVGTGMGMITARAGYFYPKSPEIPVGLVSVAADIVSQYIKKGKWEDPLSSLFSGLIGASTPTIKGTLKNLFPKMDEATLEFISKSLSGASKVEQVVITENLKRQIQEQTQQKGKR